MATPNIKCDHCGYEWVFKGKLKRATCPNCGNKVGFEFLKKDDYIDVETNM